MNNIEAGKKLENPTDTSYRSLIEAQLDGSRVKDYLSYDDEGNLWINNLRVIDAIAKVASADREGTPLTITDTNIIELRCQQWVDLTTQVAEAVGYKGGFGYFYAGKANRSSEVVHAALRSGWNIETSSRQDLDDIRFLTENGLVDKAKLAIICNGFKLPPDNRWDTAREQALPAKETVIFEQQSDGYAVRYGHSYAEKILHLKQDGYKITPILDVGELEYFLENSPQMEVGLRMKFGRAANDEDLAKLVSRFGMTWEEIQESAAKIEQSENLTLTMLHAMVGAAETIERDEFVTYLSLAVDKYIALAKKYPSLRSLNIGGGIPPFSENYDHAGLITQLLTIVKEKAAAAQVPEPSIVFELGSYVAAESGFYAFDILQQKQNSESQSGNAETWALIDGSLMEAIPDMLITQKNFSIIAVNNANANTKEVRLGDLTCDSDGRYPTKANDAHKVLMPDSDTLTYLIILGVGAYQEQLAGVKGGHHCGLLEAAQIIIEDRADGNTYARFRTRQSYVDSQKIFDYTEEHVSQLQQTLKHPIT